jgi:hypothetical protein
LSGRSPSAVRSDFVSCRIEQAKHGPKLDQPRRPDADDLPGQRTASMSSRGIQSPLIYAFRFPCTDAAKQALCGRSIGTDAISNWPVDLNPRVERGSASILRRVRFCRHSLIAFHTIRLLLPRTPSLQLSPATFQCARLSHADTLGYPIRRSGNKARFPRVVRISQRVKRARRTLRDHPVS